MFRSFPMKIQLKLTEICVRISLERVFALGFVLN